MTVRWLEDSPQASVRWLEPDQLVYGTPMQLGQAEDEKKDSTWRTIWTVAGVAGAALGAYHGYKRNHGSVGWAIGWSIFGSFLPFFSIPLSLAEGFGKPK
jgi:hypothetical protein